MFNLPPYCVCLRYCQLAVRVWASYVIARFDGLPMRFAEPCFVHLSRYPIFFTLTTKHSLPDACIAVWIVYLLIVSILIVKWFLTGVRL